MIKTNVLQRKLQLSECSETKYEIASWHPDHELIEEWWPLVLRFWGQNLSSPRVISLLKPIFFCVNQRIVSLHTDLSVQTHTSLVAAVKSQFIAHRVLSETWLNRRPNTVSVCPCDWATILFVRVCFQRRV